MLDNLKLGRQISIHALRGEGDNSGSYACGGDKYFNPRPPWGGRRVPHDILVLTARTISIHALRGEGDDYVDNHLFGLQISIHALRGEGDLQACGAERQ